MSVESVPYTGEECLKGGPLDVGEATILDFWRWAFSGLRWNDLRGVFAEWLVAQLLGIELAGCVRDSWGACDIATKEGVRIEVKCAAYVQAWSQQKPSSMVFGSLKAKLWDPEHGYAATATHNADLYVFCVQTEQDDSAWDALDLEQWRFVLLTQKQAQALGTRSVGLKRLIRAAGRMLSAAELQAAAREAICEAAAKRNEKERGGQGPDPF